MVNLIGKSPEFILGYTQAIRAAYLMTYSLGGKPAWMFGPTCDRFFEEQTEALQTAVNFLEMIKAPGVKGVH